MTREGDVIEDPASDGRLEVLGVTDLVAWVVHPDDKDKKRPRYIPKVVGRVVHGAKHIPNRGSNVVEEW